MPRPPERGPAAPDRGPVSAPAAAPAAPSAAPDAAAACPACGSPMRLWAAYYRCRTCGFKESCCF